MWGLAVILLVAKLSGRRFQASVIFTATLETSAPTRRQASIPLARPSEPSPRFAANHPIPSPGNFPRAANIATRDSLRVTATPPCPATNPRSPNGLPSRM